MISHPKVSVILFCKNRICSIERSVKSVLNQQWPNLEYVIQDGMSTDGTLEFLKSCGPSLDIISMEDTANDAFWNTLRRCTGKYIATCLSDEEILPHALEDGVSFMENNPESGAVTRDALLTDISGSVIGEALGSSFNQFEFMSARRTPHFSATIFRREALLDIDLYNRKWDSECGEFELWCRLCHHHLISYLPGYASKYAIHNQQLSNNPTNIMKLLSARLRVIDKIADEYSLLGDTERCLCKAETVLHFISHIDNFGHYREAKRCLTENMMYIDAAMNSSLINDRKSNWCIFCSLLQDVGLWSPAEKLAERIVSVYPETALSRTHWDCSRPLVDRLFYIARREFRIIKLYFRDFLARFKQK
jgi:glycosyltransferase involved in cell wall biosynthesis